jgi:hypothetical protein
LRRSAVVGRVSGAPGEPVVALAADVAAGPAPLARAAAAVRSVPNVGIVQVYWDAGDERQRTVDVTSDAPSDALVGALDAIAVRPDASWLLSVERRDATAARPDLTVESLQPETDATALAGASDPPADRGERPRTSFTVREPGSDSQITGYVGLPLGSSEPELTWQRLDEAATATDPDELTRMSADDERTVRDFLLASARAAGSTVEPDIRTFECDGGAGAQATIGSMLIPLWSDPDATTESVNRAFDDIGASWTKAGLVPRERALGTDIWGPATPGKGPAAIDTARIRGTTEGIRIYLTGVCRR